MSRPRPQAMQYNSTLATATGISFESRPPCGLLRLGLRCLYTLLTPSTTTLFSSGMTRSTRAVVPRSSPVTTRTMSPLRINIVSPSSPRGLGSSHHLGGQTDDAREVALAQFAGHRPEDAGALRVLLLVDDDHSVAVEADVGAVVAPRRPLGPHHDAADHVARLDVAAGDRLLDAGDD